jgi:hypothetical protein
MTRPEYKDRKTWQFWCVWEGYDIDEVKFDDSGLEDGEVITYPEYRERLIST